MGQRRNGKALHWFPLEFCGLVRQVYELGIYHGEIRSLFRQRKPERFSESGLLKAKKACRNISKVSERCSFPRLASL